MDCIDKKDNPDENATFTLEGMPPIPLRSIKIFKRENRSSRSIAINTDDEIESLPNTFDMNNLARSLPRYDKESDIAICYLAEQINSYIAPTNTQALLNDSFPIKNLCGNNTELVFDMDNDGIPNKIRFHAVNSQASALALAALMNAHERSQVFIIGYPGFNSQSQTISRARPLGGSYTPRDTIALCLQFATTISEYNFEFDAPIYHGMSGGPIFTLTPGIPIIIDIFGVVRALSFGSLAQPHPSRCDGSFLR
jgi:hypothetical protein